MSSPILPVGNAPSPELIRVAQESGKPGEFQAVLEGAVRGVEQSRAAAATAVETFLSGEGEEVHSAALAVQRAELALDLFLQVRNKVVQAYQEIMRMQI